MGLELKFESLLRKTSFEISQRRGKGRPSRRSQATGGRVDLIVGVSVAIIF